MCAHKNRSGRYATPYALVKDFLEFDSISTNPDQLAKDQSCKKSRSHFRIIAI
jgi:hypothetical protein